MTTNHFLDIAKAGVQQLQPYQPGKSNEELEREYGIAESIKLASNENPRGPSKLVREAIQHQIAISNLYPDGSGHLLKNKLANLLGLANSQITLGNGSNDVLELVARTFAGPGDEVIFSTHAFAVYPIVTSAVGALRVEVPARSWGHDLQAMAAAVSEKTRIIFIANPNNPTGTWLTDRALYQFVKDIPANIIIVIDEAYFEYITEPDFPQTIAWLTDFSNLVVCRTFSKIHGLAGLRIGYGLSNPDIAELLNRVRQPFNTNRIAQAAAIAAIDDTEYVQESRIINTTQMQVLVEAFDKLGVDYIPSVGNFITIDPVKPAMEIYENLLRQGIIVRPVLNYGLPNHLRITVGSADQNDRMLLALKRAIG